ncbi:MAG TPA: amino acid adenylation domain-containing protein, partial [Thermoanaerobaculia bacterium]|nr:amino acid adenylation domain-containing protein [Thermoanaerobaculia bacterium]
MLGRTIDPSLLARFRSLSSVRSRSAKNPRAVFILSPPRSGSTLLRVMLAGHPALFAPPELELLGFATLRERRETFSGRNTTWAEGTIRALMEIHGCTGDEARQRMEEYEARDLTVRDFYLELQRTLGDRILVDKTPSYSLDLSVLQRAEELFQEPLYIHLIRHPGGMVVSFEEARLDQVFFHQAHDFSRRQLAELTWLTSHQNIREMLAGIPGQRQVEVRYEDLVRQPRAALETLCRWIGIELQPAMLDPYEGSSRRMTDGIHPLSKMVGDVKFHLHSRIDPTSADRWRERLDERELSEPTREMAAVLGYAEVAAVPVWEPIAPVPRGPDAQLPLSFAQQRLWFFDQLVPGSPAYNLSSAVRIQGSLAAAALERTLREIARRHEVLRTTFVANGGSAVQVISPEVRFRLARIDLSGLLELVRDREVERLGREEERWSFDLSVGPLWRAALLALGENEHIALLTLHHIVTDGWSMGILVREIGSLYPAFARGDRPALPPPSIQYGDFSVWQRSWLTGEALERHLGWWCTHLAGAPPTLDLPFDRPRPAIQSFRGRHLPTRFSAELARGLEAIRRSSGTTLFVVLLAAFQALLSRISGQEDLVVGTPVSGRDRPEISGLIGFFVNTLALHGTLAGDPTFQDLLATARGVVRGALAHQELPFERLVDELNPERSLAYSPLFQVMFSLQSLGGQGGALSLPGLTLEPVVKALPTSAKFDLGLICAESKEGLAGSWDFNRDMFDLSTIQRLAGSFERLLASAVAHPEVRVSELALLSSAEHHQLVGEWNDAAADFPRESSVDQRFAARAQAAPHRLALEFGDERLTYGELDRRANRLARRLRRWGVGEESRVGLLVERSVGMVLGMLGILKSGGAYVPLDPSYPRERLATMVDDAGIEVLVVAEGWHGWRPEVRNLVLLGDEREEKEEALASRSWAESLAYVTYTSGSTGRPKGIGVSHRAVVRLVEGTNYVDLDPEDRMAQASSVTFDAATFEVWGALLRGGTLVGIAREVTLSPRELGAALAARQVSVLFLTTALFNQMAREAPWAFATLRHVLFGGEAVTPRWVAEILQKGRPERLLHLYGPTEATTFSSWQVVAGLPPGARTLPIGGPLANARLYVVDREGRPVQAGVTGELSIGGEGLARGYEGRPELTAEGFVPDGVSGRAGERLYRTGDVVRWDGAGRIEFLGRRDHQVKVRGFRIELAEIESALGEHPWVEQAAVVVREVEAAEGFTDRQLVAFVLPAKDAPEDLGPRLRRHLGGRLPSYMVPSRVLVHPALPLTPAGKVDRQELSRWTLPAAAGTGDVRTPRGQVEELLAGIFSGVLKRESVDLDESFFDLGGHSLLATQVISRISKALRVEVPLRQLFENPTVSGLSRAIEEEQRVGLGLLAPPLVRVERRADLPLSFAQERLWFIDQLDPWRPNYNVPLALQVDGPLDPAALVESLGRVVLRHEALRTRFATVAGRPVQVVDSPGSLAFTWVDVGGLPAARREAESRRLGQAERWRPFDLARGPLLRAILLAVAAEDWRVLLTMHHIVADGWSLDVLVRELSALYSARLSGEETELPLLPVQYADFAVWQRGWLAGEVLNREIAFWRERLALLPPVLELPLDRPRQRVQGVKGASRSLVLPAGLAQRLRAQARREGATLFMLVLAAWQILLGRLTGAEQLAVGTPIAGRNRLETEGLIGFFVNTLVMPADLSGDPGFRQFLGRCIEVCLGAFAHQDLPFEKLVEELRPERSLAHSPLFQVMFSLQRPPAEPLALPDLTLSRLPVTERQETYLKFDLHLEITEHPDRIGGGLAFDSALFDATTALRTLAQLAALLSEIAVDPERRVADLPLLSPGQRHQVRSEWNDAASAFAFAASVHERFEARARLHPERPAIEFGEAIGYGELNRRANRLAHRLRALGSGPESRVGLLVEPSVGLVVGMLGILKAGGAYVPLDPSYPAERLAAMVEDAGVEILVSEPERLGGLPDTRQLVLLGEEEGEPEDDPVSWSHAESLAYVTYTSGSTGRPKGICVSHRAVVRLVEETNYVALGAQDRVAQVSNVTFDAATFEVWGALLCGGMLVGIPREVALLPAAFAASLAHERVSVLFLTTALFNQMAREAPHAFSSLRYVLFGGEAVEPRWVTEVLAKGRPGRLLHVYGPTEATTFSTWHPVGELAAESPAIPIGRALANARVYVVDGEQRVLPVGVAGELCLGGAGLARGYEGRADLTAASFVPDGCGGEPGERLYRTGDLVRWDGRGQLEFLGRRDQQVKVRGFRIELAEIESVLADHSGVDQAVALVHEVAREGWNDRDLIAYVVPRETGTAGPELARELRRQAERRLPSYMVPARVVVVPDLPLTLAGKVDRQALAGRAVEREERGASDRVAPRTPLEELVAQIWEELLGREQVGVTESFFELGGHSLLATQVISRISEALAVELPLRQLFENPTVAGVARAIEEVQRAGQGLAAPPIGRVERQGDLPLSFAQERLWFIDQLDSGRPTYNMSMPLAVQGPLDPSRLVESLGRIVERHEALRTRFESRSGRPVQVIDPPGRPAVVWVDLAGLVAESRELEMRRLAREDRGRPFHLARGPLLRAMVLAAGGEDWRVLFTMHHIVSDGWSLDVLVREVSALYAGRIRGQEPELPALLIQYTDFAVWQRGWLTGAVLEEEIAYWRERLAEVPALLALPLDHSRPRVQALRGASQSLVLPRDLSQSLRTLARREAATLFMVLLAAWQALLGRLAGAERLAVGTPIAGRNRLETERLIGFFVNTLVMSADLTGEPSFRVFLRRCREMCLEAFEHQDLPFEKLVEELRPQRSLAHAPLFQVMFAVSNPSQGLELPGLSLSPLTGLAGEEGATLRFDLELTIQERQGRLGSVLTYNRTLFDVTTAERLLGQLALLLSQIVAEAQVGVFDLALLSAAERHQLTVEWSGSAALVARPACLHELIEEQARLHPAAAAVECSGEEVSYGELDRRANQLAYRLRRLGVGPESRVGLFVERSVGLVVGMLGIFKSGGVFVPLDPSYPADRLSYVVADSGISVLVSEAERLGELPETAELVLLGDEEGEPVADLARWSRPESLAYLIYTSGTTGRPKGVMVEHRQAVHTLSAAALRFALQPGDRMTCLASFSFDIFLFELVLPLLSGARTLLLRWDEVLSPTHLAAAVERASHLHAVPSLMRRIVEIVRPQPRGRGELRAVFVGGERVEEELLAEIREVLRPARLEVLYGPTEATIICASHRAPELPEAGRPDGRRLGRPLSGVHLQVVDARGLPVPVGVGGELWVGGPGVSRGYLGRPELTAESFVPDLASELPGARSYRTGDMVRWDGAGRLEFLGRRDQQVKVRGFRVELGEIEAVLSEHASVAQAVALVRQVGQEGRRDPQIVAYVVPAEGAPTGVELDRELRRYAGDHLPSYMLPSQVLGVPSLPLSPTGKVDRRALWARGPERDLDSSGSVSWVAPRTPYEELVAQIWEELLDHPLVGVTESFFDLGGHSLLATQVISRVSKAFGVELPLRQLFEKPTVEALAFAIEEAQRADLGLVVPPLERVERGPTLPPSFSQERLWFLSRLEPGSTAYNQFLASRATGRLEVRILWQSLSEIECRHEVLRTVLEVVDGQPVQQIRESPFAVWWRVDLSGLPADRAHATVLRLAAAEARRPFDLARGPLLRFGLVRMEEEENIFFLGMHHVISDEWSMQIFSRELATLYNAAVQGRPAALPDLPIQYADYAHWQRGWLAGETLERQITYWRAHLAGVPPVLELPLDRPRPAVQVLRGAIRSCQLSAELSQSLQGLAQREGATQFMVLLAAWQALLGRLAGAERLAVGTPIAGRNRLETEGLIGFFVNTLVMSSDLSGEPSFRELLGRCREVCLEAFAHQELPFEKLVEELRPARSLSYSPLFQVMFSLQSAPAGNYELQGLSLSRLGASGPEEVWNLRFDLELTAQERKGRMGVVLTYNRMLFDATTAQRLVDQLAHLLSKVAMEPQARVLDLALLSAPERHQLTVEWSPAAPLPLPPSCLHELIEERALLQPEDTALECNGEAVGYGELNRRANRLAHRLRRLGVGPESRVGLFVERSVGLVVGLLGIFKSGGVFVPLDPSYPLERLSYIVADAGISVLISEPERSRELPDTPVLVLLGEEEEE